MQKLNILICASLVSLCILLTSCGQQQAKSTSAPLKNDYQLLVDYFKSRHDYKLSNEVKQLFILTERGCITCNKHFSQFMSKHLNKSHTLFLINAEGNRFDVSPFKNQDKNILWENPAFAASSPILNSTKVVFFEGEQIASVISISADSLVEQITDIERRMNAMPN